LGAASAILMLVFKDTILGFVASIQVSANDSIRVGDWIEMPKYGADGTVKEINLNNVKVQNFDKTITTIPTHTLLSDSFKNYRGMQQSGGRRLKRAINIKISTIRFLENEEIERLKNIQILRPYIEERAKTIDQFNTEQQIDQSSPINGRKMTNLGMFRAYTLTYLRQNPNIHKTMPLMVRQLASTEHGVPVELYFFVNDIRWEYYEGIVSDVFDHLFAATKYLTWRSLKIRHQMISGRLSDNKTFMTSQTNSGRNELKVLPANNISHFQKKAATASTFIYQVNA
jgi:miniconductance mechanosensitive channel